MGTLGHKVFEPIVALQPTAAEVAESDNEPLLYFNRTNLKATGRRTSEGFVVFKGSAVVSALQKSCPENAVKLRERYKDKIEYGGLELTVEAELFYTPGRSYFTPPDGHILQ